MKPLDEAALRRLESKSRWRFADTSSTLERRVKFRTNIQRRAGQRGGLDESADPAAPFTLSEGDPNPARMPLGTYWSNSGQYFYHSESIDKGLRGGPQAARRYEFVFLYRTPDGRLVRQQGGYASPSSSWGWDARFEYQPTASGEYELVVTQGAMELPKKMRGAPPDAGDLPEVAKHNASRTRHAFRPMKFEDGKLYLLDEGSILGHQPDANGDWISYETVKNSDGSSTHLLTSAHGYGENFIPLETDPRKLWKDEHGYPIRIFDLVTQEAHIEKRIGDHVFIAKEPMTTRSIAYRMDPNNPSKKVPRGTLLPDGRPADEAIVIMAEDLPQSPGTPVQSSIRMNDLSGKVLEVQTANADGTVTLERGVSRKLQATLVEGFNPVPGAVRFPSGKEYSAPSARASTPQEPSPTKAPRDGDTGPISVSAPRKTARLDVILPSPNTLKTESISRMRTAAIKRPFPFDGSSAMASPGWKSTILPFTPRSLFLLASGTKKDSSHQAFLSYFRLEKTSPTPAWSMDYFSFSSTRDRLEACRCLSPCAPSFRPFFPLFFS